MEERQVRAQNIHGRNATRARGARPVADEFCRGLSHRSEPCTRSPKPSLISLDKKLIRRQLNMIRDENHVVFACKPEVHLCKVLLYQDSWPRRPPGAWYATTR